ncbi:thioredoxin family protein [Pollutimonas sp. M17]|uniref:thioredoxin family protein n=1 Tax=Pollutimonas sp. M17 TaxID=2962065 RepID=UPI0021F4305F|nr:thioredoxin family protein [Pollutimonas sp. M17]UYO92861.1 thioredoxin family protein [Pollutimonas sp. M17]
MPVFDPIHDKHALLHRLQDGGGLTVACYCAAWCDTCSEYRPQFQALAEKWPAHAFVWIDIEENPELLGDEDVENFPTLLIQSPEGNLFFGTMLPHIGHLDRLIRSLEEHAPVSLSGPGPLHALLGPAVANGN